MTDKKLLMKPVAAAVGLAFVTSLAVSSTVLASDNPFSAADLDSGYLVAGEKGEEGKCGEGKCGEKGEEGKCGEKGEEGKCGEGKCGEKGEEGSCGEKGEEGSCGEKGEEGKCGGNEG